MDNQNTYEYGPKEYKVINVLILVLMDNQNTAVAVIAMVAAVS